MTEFLQQTVSGLTTGLVYAALALAIALVFQGTGTLNFAQGEFATLAAFVAFALSSAGLSWWLVVPLLVVLASSSVPASSGCWSAPSRAAARSRS